VSGNLEQRTGSLRGDLIKWAREEQQLTMRWVADHGGPCLGYQSEVENQKKAEVRSEKLTGWIRALNVTEPFVRGHVPRYTEHPDQCHGLAADVGRLIITRRGWAAESALERARLTLCLTSRESRLLPRVVLAHVLGMGLDTLEGYMDGSLPVVKEVMLALCALTGLPESFFTHGILPDESEAAAGDDLREWLSLRAYREALVQARRLNITPEKLEALIRQSLS